MNELVILDFETTGLSPSYARIIEVGAIVLKDNKITDKFTQLMHPGTLIPHFITEITGITNQMVKGMPTSEKVMPLLKKFIGKRPILAHNAQFDQKFLISEMQHAGKQIDNSFLCTLKLARRLLPDAPNHQLGTLASYLKLDIPKGHQAHRALDDVIITSQIWQYLNKTIAKQINGVPDMELLIKLSSIPKNKINHFLKSLNTA